MATILVIELSGWFYCLKHSQITQKQMEQFYYDKTMVNFCKGCDQGHINARASRG